MRRTVGCICIACAAACLLTAPVPATAQQAATRFSEVVPPGGGTTRAPGDVIETFANAWAPTALGVAFDPFDGTRMVYFHESVTPGIWFVAIAAGHAATGLTYTKLGGPDVDGGTVDPGTGDIYAADYNGDLNAIDDNVYRFHSDGTTVAYWELDGGLTGTQCTGGVVDQVLDIAMSPTAGEFYVTNAVDNLIHRVDLSNTSGGAGASSPCVVLGTIAHPVAAISNVLGIEYDPTNNGYWLSDWNSTNVALVDSTFTTVIVSFSGGAGTFNSGISPQDDGTNPMPVWVTDWNSNGTAILEGTSTALSTDLAITKTSDAVGTVYGGDQFTYTVGVTNNGPDDASGVVVTDVLPTAVAYVSDTCGGAFDSGSHTWTWTIGALTNGASVSCDVVVEVVPGANGQIDNTASVAGTEVDPTPGNDAATSLVAASSAVPGIPALGTGGAALLVLLLAAGAIFVIVRRIS